MPDENQKPEKAVVYYMILFIVYVDVNILTKFTPKIQSTPSFKISNDIWFLQEFGQILQNFRLGKLILYYNIFTIK